MFKKILIANRGEIAVRVMATCREMGIATVAVYSEADRQAQHVLAADEAYYLGPAPARESYLHIPAILEAARQSGAEAIHPGYGFLSENADFVEACSQAGLVFIGPPASAMRLMGSKIGAKQLAESVKAPTIPGYKGEHQDTPTFLEEAGRIGYPLLIKASAGGGGKGMREVHRPEDFADQLAGAQREALSAFGDGTVFLEKLIQQPRHIEIQVLGDSFDHLIHLGERECSIQRRHQKIVEESPSSVLAPELRARMGNTAVNIARAASYVNAGTMEFMLDTDGQFYFLEMNTRLQVEHPVTEFVTGLDLVRQQILIASGLPLTITQEQITPRGHAIEVRIYAEDPEQGFIPSTGTVTRFIAPIGPGIRLDSGIVDGDEISQYYDPMIAKLIVSAEDRPSAVARLKTALERTAIFGVTTNLPLLHAVISHPAFLEGQTTTGFLNEYHLLDMREQAMPDEVPIAAALYDITREGSSGSPWQRLGPWRLTGEGRRFSYHYQEKEQTVLLIPSGSERDWQISLNGGERRSVRYITCEENILHMQIGQSQWQIFVDQTAAETGVFFKGQRYRLVRKQAPDVNTTGHGGVALHSQKALTAPMAGTIVKVNVEPGASVTHRQVLVILTAMKMEHSIVAPYDGTVRHVLHKEGDVVKGGVVIVEME